MLKTIDDNRNGQRIVSVSLKAAKKAGLAGESKVATREGQTVHVRVSAAVARILDAGTIPKNEVENTVAQAAVIVENNGGSGNKGSAQWRVSASNLDAARGMEAGQTARDAKVRPAVRPSA